MRIVLIIPAWLLLWIAPDLAVQFRRFLVAAGRSPVPEPCAGERMSVYYADFMKWLILSLVVWLVWRLFRSLQRPVPPSARAPAGETMHACAHCGLNVPASEALIESETLSYCSAAHRRLGPKAQGRSKS